MICWRKDFLRMAPVGLLGLFKTMTLVLGLIKSLSSEMSGSQPFSGLAFQRETEAPSCLGIS